MDDSTKDFLTYDYGEAKDLAKSFLTLVSAILVGTITFSEKIVNFQTASTAQRLLVIASWTFFVLSIVLSGVAIVLDYNSVLTAVSCGNRTCDVLLPLRIRVSAS